MLSFQPIDELHPRCGQYERLQERECEALAICICRV